MHLLNALFPTLFAVALLYGLLAWVVFLGPFSGNGEGVKKNSSDCR